VDAPTPDEARRRSSLLTSRYPAGTGDDPLEALLLDAGEIVAALTCRLIAPATSGTEVPPSLLRTATRAIVLKAEKMATGEGATDAEDREDAIADQRLRSISAGPWSESYFGPDEATKARMLDPDPALNEALWMLATEDCRNAWLALWGGQQPPAAAVTQFDYTTQLYG
jgi:hypothetical protein